MTDRLTNQTKIMTDDNGITRRNVLLSAGAAAGVLGIGSGKYLQTLDTDQAQVGTALHLLDESEIIRTSCAPNCRGKCPLNAYVRDGQVKFVEPQMTDDERYRRACLLGQSHVQRMYSPTRLKYPMKRVDWSPDDPNPGGRGEPAEFEQITWDEALDYVADEMLRVREEYGPESVYFHAGSGDNGVGISVLTRLAEQFGGSLQDYGAWSIDTNVGRGFNRITGHGFFLPDTNLSEDWVNAQTIIVWGSDIFKSQFQNDASKILDAMEAGAKLVVIDPVYTTTASKADLWMPIKPGKDTHVALAMIHEVLAEELYDAEFLRERTTAGALVRDDTEEMLRMADLPEGEDDDDRVVGVDRETGDPVPLEPETYADVELFGEYEVDGISCSTGLTLLEAHVQDYPPEEIAEISALHPDDIRTAANWLATRGPGGICASYALGRYKYGHVFGQTYAILMALTGDYGKSGTIHAHHPGGAILDAGEFLLPEDAEGATRLFMHELPEALEDEDPFPVKVVYGMVSNMLANQFPDRKRWFDLLENVDLLVTADIHHTPTVQHSDIILPANHWFEREDITDAAFSHPLVAYREKALESLWDSKDDYYILSDLADRLGYDDLFAGDKTEDLRRIAENDGRFDFDELRENGNLRVDDDPIRFTDPFPTDSGRIEIYDEDMPVEEDGTPLELPRPIEDRTADDHEQAGEYPLLFMQKHSKWRIHSQWADNVMVRRFNAEPVLDIHPDDARVRGIEDGDYVRVHNDRGEMVVKAKYNEGFQPGLVNTDQGWWTEDFVEGNLQDLTHLEVNDLAPTFAFYDVRVEVEPAPEDIDTSMYTDQEPADWLGAETAGGDD